MSGQESTGEQAWCSPGQHPVGPRTRALQGHPKAFRNLPPPPLQLHGRGRVMEGRPARRCPALPAEMDVWGFHSRLQTTQQLNGPEDRSPRLCPQRQAWCGGNRGVPDTPSRPVVGRSPGACVRLDAGTPPRPVSTRRMPQHPQQEKRALVSTRKPARLCSEQRHSR